MYKEASPHSAPDMSNYYRLLAEARRREEIKKQRPDFEEARENMLAHPLVKTFTNAAEGNARCELRIFMSRMFEAAISDNTEHEKQGAHSVKQIGQDMLSYAHSNGIPTHTATLAVQGLTKLVTDNQPK